MPLHLSSSELTPIIKYNAKAGRWYKRGQDASGNWLDFEVPNLVAVFDLANIRTGWLLFNTTSPPIFVQDADLATPGASPGDGYKRGFRLTMFSEKLLDGAREMMANSGVTNSAINALYSDFENAPERAQGVPVVAVQNPLPVTGQHGTNYQPVFKIIKWIAPPPAMTAALAPAPAAAPPAAQAAPPGVQTAAAALAPAPAAAAPVAAAQAADDHGEF